MNFPFWTFWIPAFATALFRVKTARVKKSTARVKNKVCKSDFNSINFGPRGKFQLSIKFLTNSESNEPNRIPKLKKESQICTVNGLDWHCCLAGSSKTAPKILIVSIAMVADYLFDVKIFDIWAPPFFKHNNSIIATVLQIIYSFDWLSTFLLGKNSIL